MKKPHVLFVTEKYADGNPMWLSNSHHNLFGSLECSNLATYSNFYFEDHPQHLDDNLITFHRRLMPDLTVITLLANFPNNPTDKAFKAIASKGPLMFVWFDTVFSFIMKNAEAVSPYATINLVLDNPFCIPKDKFLTLWTPQDTRIYKDPGEDRDIDVSFVGSMSGYPDRNQMFNYLAANCGANIYRDGGQREGGLTPQEYASVMQKSKISLSFSKTRYGHQQTKGRIWEITSCGAMMMEDVNQGTGLWFEPFKDYVPFTSQEDMTDKINYYLSHPNEMAEIAGNGKKKAETHYNPKNWWSIIFNKCIYQITKLNQIKPN
jgi:hypothetical protein